MHKKGLCVKKWTKIDSNIGTKIMFFPIIQRTLLKKPRKIPSQGSLYQTQKLTFLTSKTCFFFFYPKKSKYHTQICLNQKTV